MKRKPTSTQGKPVLDQGAFQQLLAAVYILQKDHDRLLEKETKADCAALSYRAEDVRPIQQMAPPSPERVAVPVLPLGRVAPDVERLALQSDSVIPPGTAYQLSVLASQLEALIQQRVRTDSVWTTRLPVTAPREIPAEEQQAVVHHPEGQEKAAFEQPQSGSTQLIQLNDVPSGRSFWPNRIVRRQISQGNEFFWTTATVFAVAAVLFLLLGAPVHPLSPFPGGVSSSSERVQQQTPSHRTIATESLATKSAEPLVLSNQPAAHAENGSSENGVTKSNSLRSTFSSEAHLVAEKNARVAWEIENRIAADRRLQTARVQVRVSNGIVTLVGNVGSDAERVAAAQDAARIRGIDALVNTLQVITKPQSPTGNLQEPSASVAPILKRPAAEGSTAEAVSNSTSHGIMASSNTHPRDSKVTGVSTSSSPLSTSSTSFSEPEQINLPYGTLLAVRLTETLSSDLNQPGDTFLASLASPIVIGNRVIVPEGASVKGKIVDARNARRFRGRSALVIEATHLAYNGRTYELRSSQYSMQGPSRNGYAAAAITGGAGVGAVIGTLLGRGKGAAIGAVLGAATGTGVQAVTKPASAELSAETALSLRLETPLSVVPSSTLQRVQRAGPDFSQNSFPSDDRPVLKRRAGSPFPDTNTNTPGASPTSNTGSPPAPSPRHN